MKTTLFVCLLVFNGVVSAQCLIPGNRGDSSFPVTNSRFNYYDTSDYELPLLSETAVFGMTKKNNTLFLFGAFTNLSPNYGRGVIIDSISKNILTQKKWAIDGEVKAAVSDGQGGFYIAGNFKKIGDSTRRFIARIDAVGKPTAWTLDVDTTINALYRKNDTLFLGGEFSRVRATTKKAFAIYSISGDSLFSQGLLNATGTSYPYQIAVFKTYNDTLLVGGHQVAAVSGRDIMKFNIRTLTPIAWVPIATDYYVTSMEVSLANRTLFFTSRNIVTAIDLFTGVEKYSIRVSTNTSVTSDFYGAANTLKIVGNKLYIGGHFNYVYVQFVRTKRRGVCAIDIRNGSLLNIDLALDHYGGQFETIGDKLYVGGYFSHISGVEREHFAELDTGTLAVTNWNLAPTDPISVISISNGKFFAGGIFNGVHAVHRNGLAAIDMLTNEILPFNPSISLRSLDGLRRMLVHGDSLYVLAEGGASLSSSPSTYYIINTITGETTRTPCNYYDIAFDDQHLYIARPDDIWRYWISSMQRDVTWAIDYNSSGLQIDHLVLQGNKVYASGRSGNNVVFIQGNKTSPSSPVRRNYAAPPGNSAYTANNFTLKNDSIIYLKGDFLSFSGQPRHHLVSININTGLVTDWKPTFQTGMPALPFSMPTLLFKYMQNKLWFGASAYHPMSSGRSFYGLGAIDSSGILLPAPLQLAENVPSGFSYVIRSTACDILFTDDFMYVAGSFDLVNGRTFRNLLKIPLIPSSASIPDITSSISGPAILIAGSDSTKYYIPGADPSNYSYQWTYTGTGVELRNNGYDTIWLIPGAAATPGILKVKALNYCGYGNETQVSISVGATDLTLQDVLINPSTVPTGTNFNAGFTEFNTGNVPAASNKILFYLSANNVLTPGSNGDILLGEYIVNSPVAPGAGTGPLNKELSLPCTISPGNYFLFIVADAASEVHENNETNNTVSSSFIVSAGITAPSAPAIVATPSPIVCAGTPVTLTATPVSCPACTFTWNTGETGPVIVVTTSGTYSVTATNTCGSTTSSRPITVRPLPVINITSSGNLCAGNTITLTATGATSYSWTGSGLNATNASSVTAVLPSIGNASYTVTGTTEGCMQTKTITLTVLTAVAPTLNISYSGCPSSTLVFQANSTNVGTNPQYQWFVNNIAAGTGPAFTLTNAVTNTEVKCTMVADNPCANPQIVSAITMVNCVTTAVADIDGLDEYAIMPNPSSGLFRVRLKLTQQKQISMLVSDMHGKTIYERKAFPATGTVIRELNLQHTAAGIYYLKIFVGKQFFISKILKI